MSTCIGLQCQQVEHYYNGADAGLPRSTVTVTWCLFWYGSYCRFLCRDILTENVTAKSTCARSSTLMFQKNTM